MPVCVSLLKAGVMVKRLIVKNKNRKMAKKLEQKKMRIHLAEEIKENNFS